MYSKSESAMPVWSALGFDDRIESVSDKIRIKVLVQIEFNL